MHSWTASLTVLKAFKLALIKVARETDALIVTGGSDCGVMKLVGDAVLENLHKGPVLGIATWLKLIGHDKLKSHVGGYCVRHIQMFLLHFPISFLYIKKIGPNEAKKEDDEVAMNPNHTHFILVSENDGDGWGTEIDFRTKLEQALARESGKPMFLIVLEGGPGTLKTISKALECKFPVILVTVRFY